MVPTASLGEKAYQDKHAGPFYCYGCAVLDALL